MSDQGVEAELELHLATPVQTASRNTAYSSSTKSRRDGKDGHLHCMDAHGLRVSATFDVCARETGRSRNLGCRLCCDVIPPFCGATFITGGGAGGDPLSASLRALVGAGSADPSKSRKSPVKTPPRRRGAPGGKKRHACELRSLFSLQLARKDHAYFPPRDPTRGWSPPQQSIEVFGTST